VALSQALTGGHAMNHRVMKVKGSFTSYRDDVCASINSISSINSHLKVDEIQFAAENVVKQFENDPGRNVGGYFRATH
jgi:hypothetical protein